MVITDYDFANFERYLKKYHPNKNMIYEEVLKEFYLNRFQEYLNKK